MEIRCPDCGKILTPADSKEPCPKTLHQHGLHPIVVIDLSKVPAEFYGLYKCEHCGNLGYRSTFVYKRKDGTEQMLITDCANKLRGPQDHISGIIHEKPQV